MWKNFKFAELFGNQKCCFLSQLNQHQLKGIEKDFVEFWFHQEDFVNSWSHEPLQKYGSESNFYLNVVEKVC